MDDVLSLKNKILILESRVSQMDALIKDTAAARDRFAYELNTVKSLNRDMLMQLSKMIIERDQAAHKLAVFLKASK